MNKAGAGVATFAIFIVAWPAFGGQVGGSRTIRDTVMPNQTDEYNNMVFEKGEEAFIRVRGDGSSDIDCFVYDNKGGLITSDTDSTDLCILRWTPAWTGKFKLKIQNLGSKPNEYEITTN